MMPPVLARERAGQGRCSFRCRSRSIPYSLAALYHLPPQPCAHSLAVRSGLLVNERGCVTSAALRDQAQLHDRCLYCLYLYYLRRLWP